MALTPFVEQYKQDLQRQLNANPRLQLMFGLIVVIILVSAIMEIVDARRQESAQLEKQYQILNKLQSLKNETHWPQSLAQEQKVNQQLRQSLWQANSAELAAADLQNFINTLLKKHQVKFPRLKLNEAQILDNTQNSIWKIQLELNGVLPGEQLVALLNNLSNHPKEIIIEQFSYTPQRGQRLFILLSAYFTAPVKQP